MFVKGRSNIYLVPAFLSHNQPADKPFSKATGAAAVLNSSAGLMLDFFLDLEQLKRVYLELPFLVHH